MHVHIYLHTEIHMTVENSNDKNHSQLTIGEKETELAGYPQQESHSWPEMDRQAQLRQRETPGI